MSIQFENLNFTSRDSSAAFLRLSTDKLYNIMSLCELDAKTIYNVCQIFVVVGHPKIHCYRAADGAAIKLSESETIFHSKRQLCSYHLKYLGNQSRMKSGDIIVETFTLCLIIFRTNKPPFFPVNCSRIPWSSSCHTGKTLRCCFYQLLRHWCEIHRASEQFALVKSFVDNKKVCFMTVFCGQHGATAHLSAESRMSEDFFYYLRHFRSFQLKENMKSIRCTREWPQQNGAVICVWGNVMWSSAAFFFHFCCRRDGTTEKKTQQSTDLKYMSGKKIYHTMCPTRRKIINLLLILFSFPFPKAKADTNIYWIKKIERAKRS